MTGAQRAASAAEIAASSPGVVPVGSKPWRTSCSRTRGTRSATTIAHAMNEYDAYAFWTKAK